MNKFKKRTTFDAASQYISTSGQYKFVAPGSGDQRGPCPGLNALANHNYLPHNGVATITEFINATMEVFGMGLDLATFLATYGALVDGDGTKWSIGGPTPNVPGLLGLIGQPQGISGSHNKYESDASPTRGDLYQTGNDYTVQMSQFQQLYDLGKAADNYDLQLLTDFRHTRFQQSIANNPDFFYAPFSGVIVTPAAYTFIYRYMANKSAEYPDGQLNGNVLKSFFAISGNDGSFQYNPGYERIPDNWYTRSRTDPYGILELNLDTVAMATQYPEFLVPGGNLGTTNSYVGLNPSNLTGGVVSAGDLLTNNEGVCLAYQAAVQLLPDILNTVVSDITAPLNKLTGAFSSVEQTLNCPKLSTIDTSQFSQYPGYTKSQ
ncbi:Cloroperoxidase [Myriangium duriaei CBS 260.36]|uniref:Cloroperoxidase n=1 Tax=Myriangium duriaei CBS 260.36 TaxID=1168546 RepID=A0A9P4IS52_9PEZI|nr:Cloroperoxidase [Myriangium duriaei CBS 260.36]